jgi:plasmid segregation protein ParM
MSKRELLVAVDDGYAQMKCYGDTPEGQGTKAFVMRSAIAVGRRGLGSINGDETVDAWETDGRAFTVSDAIQTENTQLDSFHFSDMNRVLINHALYAAGYGGRKVSLVAGLPVANFFAHGMRNDEAIDKKKQNLLKAVKLTSSNADVAEIVDVRIGCQAVAAYVDWLLDDNLNERRSADSRVAIVDIGGRTTDIAVVIGGRQIDHDKSGTANTGVLDVYSAVERGIQKQFDIPDRLSLNQLDQVVRTEKVKLFGRDENVTKVVRDAVSEQEEKIRMECERKIGSGATLDAIVFVGGGSALFKTINTKFRNAVMIENPEIANARGMWKFFRWREMQSVPTAAE